MPVPFGLLKLPGPGEQIGKAPMGLRGIGVCLAGVPKGRDRSRLRRISSCRRSLQTLGRTAVFPLQPGNAFALHPQPSKVCLITLTGRTGPVIRHPQHTSPHVRPHVRSDPRRAAAPGHLNVPRNRHASLPGTP